MPVHTQKNLYLSSLSLFRLACQIELRTQQMLSVWDSQPEKLHGNKHAISVFAICKKTFMLNTTLEFSFYVFIDCHAVLELSENYQTAVLVVDICSRGQTTLGMVRVLNSCKS